MNVLGVRWNQPVSLSMCLCVFVSVHVFVCVQDTSFCESADRGNKSHLVMVLVTTRYLYTCIYVFIPRWQPDLFGLEKTLRKQ